MTAFTIRIHDAQRQILIKALNTALASPIFSDDDQSGHIDDESELSEAMMLLEMLAEIPKLESEDPGITHGLCL